MSTYKSMSSGDTLVPRSTWLPNSALEGDVGVLKDNTGTFVTAFQRILELHKPNHPIALFSLCTSTRPYSVSEKWKAFIERFGDRCDPVVYSNGGVIPLDWEFQYPFMEYDAKSTSSKTTANLYREIVGARLKMFLESHRYEYVLFATLLSDTSDRIRNVLPDLCEQLVSDGFIKGFAIMPDEKLNAKIKETLDAGKVSKYHPLKSECFLDAVESQIQKWSKL
jgi:hypothetical protein